MNKETLESFIEKGLDVDRDTAAEHMTKLLTDENWTTYKMYESLVSSWLHGSEEYREGMDEALSILTGWSLKTITKDLLEKMKENDEKLDEETERLLEEVNNEAC